METPYQHFKQQFLQSIAISSTIKKMLVFKRDVKPLRYNSEKHGYRERNCEIFDGKVSVCGKCWWLLFYLLISRRNGKKRIETDKGFCLMSLTRMQSFIYPKSNPSHCNVCPHLGRSRVTMTNSRHWLLIRSLHLLESLQTPRAGRWVHKSTFLKSPQDIIKERSISFTLFFNFVPEPAVDLLIRCNCPLYWSGLCGFLWLFPFLSHFRR